jgi:RecG-like helicase
MELSSLITDHFRLVATQKKALSKLGLVTIQDLLFHFPTRYENINDIKSIAHLTKGDAAVVYGTLSKLATRKSFRNKKPIAEGYIEDGTGKMKIIWFHQPYIAKMLEGKRFVKLSGKVTGSPGKLYLANPEIEPIDSLPITDDDSLFQITTFILFIRKAWVLPQNGFIMQWREYLKVAYSIPSMTLCRRK